MKKKTKSSSKDKVSDEVGRPVKTFVDLGGVLVKDTTGDRVKPVADPYESGNERAQNVDPIEDVRKLRGGYEPEE